MKAYERFLNYVMVNTKADGESSSIPSSSGQKEFAQRLFEELSDLGVKDLILTEQGYLYGKIPSNLPPEEPQPLTVGFIAHLDTAPNLDSPHVRPKLIQPYQGEVIPLENGLVHDPSQDPCLQAALGAGIIITDGTTLLGGDDKAGVAEIVTMVEYVMTHPDYHHGPIAFAFTPDEEIGGSCKNFDINRFGADVAYTIDGEGFGTLEYENFCSGAAVVTIQGVMTHPGYAKNLMKNALVIGTEFHQMLPAWERPEHTEGYEGFQHLAEFNGDCGACTLGYLIRDFDAAGYEQRQARFQRIADYLNGQYGEGTVQLERIDANQNMASRLQETPYVIEFAKESIAACGVEPQVTPIRGGTDGVKLTFMGVPCPNLGTGSYHHHSALEFANIREMDQCVELMLRLGTRFASTQCSNRENKPYGSM